MNEYIIHDAIHKDSISPTISRVLTCPPVLD
jgi:hypothetical protein